MLVLPFILISNFQLVILYRQEKRNLLGKQSLTDLQTDNTFGGIGIGFGHKCLLVICP